MEALQHKILNRHCLVHTDYTECALAWRKEILICEGILQLSYFTLLNIECQRSGGVIYQFFPFNIKITYIYFDHFYDSLGLPPSATRLFS